VPGKKEERKEEKEGGREGGREERREGRKEGRRQDSKAKPQHQGPVGAWTEAVVLRDLGRSV
jgi:hypothetical protein